MTIEKINDNQIRFVLTGEDLAARQIRLSELAYGSDKARDLFREMMQQASSEYGFEAAGPMMIEAIPMHSGSIVLIVTRVDNPEELDPRFASFSPSVQNSVPQQTQTSSALALLEHLIEALCSDSDADSPESEPESGEETSDGASFAVQCGRRAAAMNLQQEAVRQFREFALLNRLYLFSSMDSAIQGAGLLAGQFGGESILFREDGIYSLLLKLRSKEEAQALEKPLAAVSEYGSPAPVTAAREQYLKEHGRILIAQNAVEALSGIG